MTKRLTKLYLYIFTILITTSCSLGKYVPEGKYYLKKNQITCTDKKVGKTYIFEDYIKQSPNTKWFGAKVPLKIYTLSGSDTTKWFCKFFRKIGEQPVIYDSISATKTISDIKQMLANEGYTKAEVKTEKTIKGKKLNLNYVITPGERYYIKNIYRSSEDTAINSIISGKDTLKSLLLRGMPLNINTLNEERSRITRMLQNIGYYKFNKENIVFIADTCKGSKYIDLTMNIKLHLENGRSIPENHKKYHIGNISFLTDIANIEQSKDSISFDNIKIIYKDKLKFRPKLLLSNNKLRHGELYNEDKLQTTYKNFTQLSAISYSNILINERPETDTLDCSIIINHNRPKSIAMEIEGTNSAGDLGAAASATYQHKNLFKGSETLTFKLRGAYEAITGLDGYDGQNYTEFGGEVKLNFPVFLFPFVSREFGSEHHATSEISLQYNLQNRPEFKRRVLTAAWRYKWGSRNKKLQHRFDLLEVNYVYMPWMSKTFKEQYLDSLGRTNAILKYNYENILITKIGYTYTYNSLGSSTTTYGKNAYSIRANIETSGNLLYGLTSLYNGKQNSDGQYTFCGIAYAQYVKGDLDFTKSIRIDKNNSIALHANIGIAYPYGNTTILPFEKRYFSGGANSVRGWSIRSLGPGSYNGIDKGINFINQSGDIKLDLNLEYRAYLFWKINGAFFIDAGNIWTIRKYKDQPGGEFKLDKFYKQIAVAYGLGLRMNLDFFTLRFDAGMKAINPAYEGKAHYPITNPNLDRDFAFHFAVGLPF